MIRARICVALMVVAVAAAGCSSGGSTARPAGTAQPGTTATTTTTVPVEQTRVVVSGNATLDGAPFDAEFLGAVVRKNGLVTPCQGELPPVKRGRIEIPVLSEAESAGCGVAGSEILLWTYKGSKQYFSSRTVPWPASGHTATFNASFSTAKPDGAMLPRTEIAGQIFDRDGSQVGPGARVEAYIGNTLCGVASVRPPQGDFIGISLSIVGPDSVAGCTRNGKVTFRVNGRKAATTAVNRFRAYRSLDITIA